VTDVYEFSIDGGREAERFQDCSVSIEPIVCAISADIGRLTVSSNSAFNAQALEGSRFSHKVDKVFQLAKKEAIASGIFFGGSGLTGNLTMLCLLGYGKQCGRWMVGDVADLSCL
jgi:hypothetical protein